VSDLLTEIVVFITETKESCILGQKCNTIVSTGFLSRWMNILIGWCCYMTSLEYGMIGCFSKDQLDNSYSCSLFGRLNI